MRGVCIVRNRQLSTRERHNLRVYGESDVEAGKDKVEVVVEGCLLHVAVVRGSECLRPGQVTASD